MATYLAVDFGAGSGRVIAGTVSGVRMTTVEVHRFGNRQVRLGNRLCWDFPALFDEMKTGLRLAARQFSDIRSIGIDTWGVDYGLVDGSGNLLGNPVCYRDSATDGAVAQWSVENDVAVHYAQAGIQIMPINTLFQLYVRRKAGDKALDIARHLLFMPDLFSYYLTGVPDNEYTIASTSELLDARLRDWNWSLIDRLGLPRRIFGKIVPPGTVRGTVMKELAEELGLPDGVKVVAVGSHDTASAVFATPYEKGREGTSAFLSSGTWSLLGIELDEPVLTEEARIAGFTNEGGVGGKIYFLQNITGLWILQCLMKQWKEAGLPDSYEYLLSEAEASDIESVIDVDAEAFMHPDDMQAAVAGYCRESGQRVPSAQGEYVRCVLHSLAVRYRKGISGLNSLTGKPVERLHVIGGGSRNGLLNRLTEQETGIPVIAGPVEATAIGNLLVQAIACGEIKEKSEITSIL